MKNSSKNDVGALATDGFVSVTYPVGLRRAVEQTIAAWQAFCALPEAVKDGLPYSNSADGVGYERKIGTGPSADRKENFDITSAGLAWLADNSAALSDDAVHDFVSRAGDLVGLIKPVVVDFARRAEAAFGIPGFASEVLESEQAYFVRFIHYYGDRAVGEETATAHTDQSGFTLHLFESDPGLQCLPYTPGSEWIDMPVSSGETVIIPSMQMQLRTKGAVKALCHRVIATEKTAITGRYSAVCFVQLARMPKYDKAAHGRLQEKNPGFNYNMNYEEFARLFR